MQNHIADRLRTGSHLLLWKEKRLAVASDFDHSQNVVFIHGFTATGEYLSDLIELVQGHQSNCFCFNYDSLGGIDTAATNLLGLFEKMDRLSNGKLTERKLTLICHSMGGLVARAFCYLPNAGEFVKALVTLGTPHIGTLRGSRHLKLLARWGESVSRAMPGYDADSCISAAQLLGADKSGAVPLLDALQESNSVLNRIPCLSISGGKRWLEFGRNRFKNAIANNRLQALLGNEDNDGLVPEGSSDVTKLPATCRGTSSQHENGYSEYSKINHSNLIANQSIALTIRIWMVDSQLSQPVR